jgi:hypothetical protein
MINRKSRTTSFLLTLLLGPLGLLYASPVAGIILLVVAIATAPTVVGPVACWVLAIAWGDHAAYHTNKNVDEFIAAIKDR